MTLFHFGDSPDLVAEDPSTGRASVGVRATLWTSKTGGTQWTAGVTDLTGGGAGGVVVSGAFGRWSFTIDDATDSAATVWLQPEGTSGSPGVRWLVRAWESYGPPGPPGASGDIKGITANEGDLLGYSGGAWGGRSPSTLGYASQSSVEAVAEAVTAAQEAAAAALTPDQLDTAVASKVSATTSATKTALDARYATGQAITDAVNALDDTVVHTSGAETIAGAKTFSAPVAIQDATAAGHAATKRQVDAVAAALPAAWDKVLTADVPWTGTGTATVDVPGLALSFAAAPADRWVSLSGTILYEADPTGDYKGAFTITGADGYVTAQGLVAGATQSAAQMRLDTFPNGPAGSFILGGFGPGVFSTAWVSGELFIPADTAATVTLAIGPAASGGATVPVTKRLSAMHATEYAP